MAIKLKNGETIVFIGDSITDCGRRGTERPLGNGYVKIFNDMLIAREPRKQVNIINKGIGGDRVTGVGACAAGLENRWQDDVLFFKPNCVSVKIGINDLHTMLRGNPDAITPEVFAKGYDAILSRTRQKLPKCKILLIDPFYISTERAKTTFRRTVADTLPEYIAVVHEMAKKYKTAHVETHAIFQRLLKNHHADTFCPEPVHPNATGHLVIAEAVYDALS